MKTTPNPIAGKIIIQGKLVCQSPLHIGSGTDERSDLDVLLDSQQRPFIPATSLVGALQSALEQSLSADDKHRYRKNLKQFWGYTEHDQGQQSALRCSDLPLWNDHEPAQTEIRDGIKIEHTNGMVKDQGKYDYEVVERDTAFALNIELNYRYRKNSADPSAERVFTEKMARTLYDMLTKGEVRLGAKTNNGLGAVQLSAEEATLYHFQFSHADHIVCWLTKANQKKAMHTDWRNQIITEADLKPAFKRNRNQFCLDVTLRLKNSLIIRSYSADPKMPDAVQISSKGKPVLTGSAFKGAIRARAERILNTLGKPSDRILKMLFGNEEKGSARKGRLHVAEVLLPDYQAELQTRIKIDRFTGGTIESALFDSMPLFSRDQDPAIKNVHIVVEDCQPSEAGLLLLVLKDLWTGDLAVGGEKNVGRGVFQGLQANLAYQGKTFQFEQCETTLKVSCEQESNPTQALQTYVDALHVKEVVA